MTTKRAKRTTKLPNDVLELLKQFAPEQEDATDALPVVVAQAKALRDEASAGFMADGYEIQYGFPSTQNPRDFLPDGGDTSDAEWVRWLADYRKAEAGEDVRWPGPVWAGDSLHIARTSWGMGVTRWKEGA